MARKQTPAAKRDPKEIVNQWIAIDEIAPHPRNYKKHPERQIKKIMASLLRFGQVRSIVVQAGPRGYIAVAGHGVLEGAKRLDWTEVKADIIPADWSPADVEGYLVADNLIGEDGETDKVTLAQIFEEQRAGGFDLASIGTSEEEVNTFFEELADESAFPDGEGEEEEDADERGLHDPEGGEVEPAYQVLVECSGEVEQRRAYELLTKQGFTAKVLTM